MTDIKNNLASELRNNVNEGELFEEFDHSILEQGEVDSKVVAFYLPQFYPFPENDEWWGKGFTEWTNTSKAFPRFSGHYQPRIPRDLGFYNLTSKDTIHKQIELAVSAGLSGFCFYYYWFNKKKMLDKPLDIFVSLEDADFPFCLMWANENWTRKWDGQESDVLLQQNYRNEDEDELLKDLSSYFSNPRYIKINKRPLFIIYRPALIPDAKETFKRWRIKWKEVYKVEPYLLMAQGFDDYDPVLYGLDGAIEFPPHKLGQDLPQIPHEKLSIFDSDFSGSVISYDDLIERSLLEVSPNFSLIKTVVPSWDNDSRRQGDGHSIIGSTPNKYQRWLKKVICYSKENPFEGKPFVFINAWNEWAEGAYLEPDIHYGSAYLNATARAITNTEELEEKDRKLNFFSKEEEKKNLAFENERLKVNKSIVINSGLFSSSYYLAHNPDVLKDGGGALAHFVKHGWREGRNPSSLFDMSAYLRKNPDVSARGVNPLIHYVMYGKKEGRQKYTVLQGSNL